MLPSPVTFRRGCFFSWQEPFCGKEQAMSDAGVCPRCGAGVPAGAAGRQCAAGVWAVGLEGGAGRAGAAGEPAAAWFGAAPEEVGAPRVEELATRWPQGEGLGGPG